jgi:hypothetical protein
MLLATGGPAAAGAREEAGAKLDAGVVAYRAGRYGDALARFQDAYATYPSGKILFNIGMTLERLGRDAEAARAFELFLLSNDQGDAGERAATARSALAQLGARLGRLQFGEDARAVALTIDGAPIILPTHRRIYVTPGTHDITVAAPGLIKRRIRVQVAAGAQRNVSLTLRLPPSPDVVAAAATRAPPRRKRVWTWVAAGAAVALAGGGLAVTVLERADEGGKSKRGERGDDWLAEGLFAGAAAAALTAGVLYVVEGRSSRSTGVAVAPSAGGGVQVWLHGVL